MPVPIVDTTVTWRSKSFSSTIVQTNVGKQTSLLRYHRTRHSFPSLLLCIMMQLIYWKICVYIILITILYLLPSFSLFMY